MIPKAGYCITTGTREASLSLTFLISDSPCRVENVPLVYTLINQQQMDLSFRPRATIPFIFIRLAVSSQKGNKK